MVNGKRVRSRARELGVAPGVLAPGPLNAITDVAGVRVGHVTVIEGDNLRTGATAILPHAGNLFQDKTPAGLAVGNGFGKLVGATQLVELGEIETPIVLTNTLAVPAAARAIVGWTLRQPGNEAVVSVNPVAGETNDSYLNDIRRCLPEAGVMRRAIEQAAGGPVAEGCVGAGTGTVCLGWKGGIGSSSRRLPAALGGFTVGVLVQTNFGGALHVLGVPVGQALGRYYLKDELAASSADLPPLPPVSSPDGSAMIVVATDAPLSDRNLCRLAARSLAGLVRTGAALSNGSGDYAIAFTTDGACRRTPQRRRQLAAIADWPNDLLSPLFLAAIEATEEAIYNSLFMATTTTGYRGHTVDALPVERVVELLSRSGRIG